MGFSNIAYPKIIYIQSAEPTNKTQGMLWVDSDDNSLNVANGTSYDSVGGASANIEEVYTGANLNCNITGYAAAAYFDHEMTAIAAVDLAGYTTMKIKITAQIYSKQYNGSSGGSVVKFQTKEIGGAYGDVYNKQFLRYQSAEPGLCEIKTTKTIEYNHTLTAGELTNGVQVNLRNYADGGNNASANTNFTLSQATIELW